MKHSIHQWRNATYTKSAPEATKNFKERPPRRELCIPRAGAATAQRAMPPALPRCAGCNKSTVDRYRWLGPAGGAYLCRGCDNESARWQVCTLAGCATRAPPTHARCPALRAVDGLVASPPRLAALGARACPACVFAHICTLHRKIPEKHALERVNNPAAQLAPVHLAMQGDIRLWLLPKMDRCLYHVARVVLWRRFSVLAGILPGGGLGSAPAVAQRLATLKQQNRFPGGDAKVVLLGMTPAEVQHLRANHLPFLTQQERARLRGFLDPLSRLRTLGGMSWADFNQDPGGAQHANATLVRRLEALLRSIRMTTGGHPRHPGLNHGHPRRWDDPGDQTFRSSLHTSQATLFQ